MFERQTNFQYAYDRVKTVDSHHLRNAIISRLENTSIKVVPAVMKINEVFDLFGTRLSDVSVVEN